MFRDELGMAPARYAEHTRLEAAKFLLVTDGESQESVARHAGFGSPERMRRIFRRNLGVAPGSYRSRFRTAGTVPGEPQSSRWPGLAPDVIAGSSQ
jgi:transcriptional regulator GlxA family with amidase domain